MIRKDFLTASFVQVLLIIGLAFFSSVRASSGTVVLFDLDLRQGMYPFNSPFRGWSFEPALSASLTKIPNDLIKEHPVPFEVSDDGVVSSPLQDVFVTIVKDDSGWNISSASFFKTGVFCATS